MEPWVSLAERAPITSSNILSPPTATASAHVANAAGHAPWGDTSCPLQLQEAVMLVTYITQYSVSTHSVLTEYSLSTRLVFTQYLLSTYSVLTQYSLSTHSVFTQY